MCCHCWDYCLLKEGPSAVYTKDDNPPPQDLRSRETDQSVLPVVNWGGAGYWGSGAILLGVTYWWVTYPIYWQEVQGFVITTKTYSSID